MRMISCQTVVQQVWTLDCEPANCSKKKQKREKNHFSFSPYVAFCLSLSHILAPKLKLCAKHSTPICYRHQLFLGFLLDGTEEWLSRIGLGARARLCALSYVTARRQMRRFTECSGLSALCLQLVFLPHCCPGEVLEDPQSWPCSSVHSCREPIRYVYKFHSALCCTTAPLHSSELMVCLVCVCSII